MKKNEYLQVLIDQQSEFKELQILTKVRLFSQEMTELIETSKLVKIVLGIRRCGKSSLCFEALKNKKVSYVNFDDERLINVKVEDLNQIYDVLKEIKPDSEVFYFDEIQNVPSWELFINRLHRNKKNIVVTGSNAKLLSLELATHLTGRQVNLVLQPLTFEEYLNWNNITWSNDTNLLRNKLPDLSRHFENYFLSGGFPEVVLGESKNRYLRELFDKIIGRDIVQRYKVRDIVSLKEVANYLVQNSGQISSYQSLLNNFSLASINTTKKYVEYLKETFLIYDLKAFSYKIKESATAARKIYACDLGLMGALWTKSTDDFGAKLETLVFLHLKSKNFDFYFLNQNKKEVDFCIIKNKKIAALIQVCYDMSQQKTKDRKLKSLIEFGQKYSVKKLYVITRHEFENLEIDGCTIEIRPASFFLLSDLNLIS